MKPREDFSLIKVILWDIDGTLLNFKMSERYAIDYCFNKFHMGTCTDEMLQRYSVINRGYWERLETGELTREQVMLGVDKPQKAFFDAVWNEIGSYAPDEVVIVGDSLTSDIRGGKNAGILTCWYNPDHLPNKIEVTPDCTIDNLQDILSYLDESR